MVENKISNYYDFITESLLELLLESNMYYSSDFKIILKKMKDNPIAKHILANSEKDINLPINYISLTDKDDTIGFTDPKKIKENKWVVVNSGESYTSFDAILKHFGIDNEYSDRLVSDGDKGIIIGEITSEEIKKHSKYWGHDSIILCHFRSDDGKNVVIDKSALVPYIPPTKTQIKVGRFARKLIDVTGIKFKDSDIEKFVNEYKAMYAVVKNDFRNIRIVKGEDIRKWYNCENYVANTGSLGGSCMKGSDCSEYFDIYVENDNVSMVILLDDFDDTKLAGRAILWKLDEPDMFFMDRVYTIADSDIEIFIEYAKMNGWAYKAKQSQYYEGRFIYNNGQEVNSPEFTIYVKEGEYDHYPYMDTLKFYTVNSGRLSNYRKGSDYILECTGGTNNQCQRCNNSGTITCRECGGEGKYECSKCEGSGQLLCNTCHGSDTIDCPICDGIGDNECKTCNGVGEDENGDVCTDCSKGRIKCSECNDGQVKCTDCRNGYEECWRCDGYGKSDCSECDGSGSEPCPDC